MGITPKFSSADVRRDIERQWAKIESQFYRIMAYVGEEFITKVRSGLNIDSGAFPKGDYTDRTANLRSSAGYAILKDGVVIQIDLQGTAEGESAAKALLSGIPKTSNGYQFIGMAGMEYASWLEAMGYNVISSQADVAIVDLSRMLKDYAARKGFEIGINSGVITSIR